MEEGTHEGRSARGPCKSLWGVLLECFLGFFMLGSVSSALGVIINSSSVTMSREGKLGLGKREKNSGTKGYSHAFVHSSIIHNSQTVDAI